MEEEKNIYDVIIVGAGPAGLTSALFSVRDGLKTLVVARTLGGTANSILKLENWPGYKGTGIELMKNFYEQLKSYPIEVIVDDVQSVEKKGEGFVIKTSSKEFGTKTLILATGTKRENKIPGEEKFVGKGVSYCATCDAFFFKDKTIAIVVWEDSSAEEIITLANLAQKVYVVCDKKFKAKRELKKVKKKIEIMNNSVLTEIKGEDKVQGLMIKDRKGEKEINVDGVFIVIGATPITEFAKKLKLKMNKENFIVVNEGMETSVKGIFAAGDVINSTIKGVLTSSAQGAIAAKNAEEFLQ
ncbi:MAG: FAD-dependent oxidoreductase [Candidatus Nanoarchaeia archaeon]|nr:FAD-dependent oxidoreductase [Candidatus Nanoarchaeia archaeon]MDD5357710.1 FAD-dependent oxidoreductase [Candidatus Nanoarchaeia archaeon]MDD5588629.1 FAD-dependent oxidoreductase [Candidatus Nanoarchaeia archaeon]